MDKMCYSCGAPLSAPGFKGPADDYCKYCSDDTGKLRGEKEVQQGIAQWLKTWQPKLDDKKAMERAAIYMKSMPAWADK